MTSKHPIACIALSAAVALKLLAGTTQPPVLHTTIMAGESISRGSTVRSRRRAAPDRSARAADAGRRGSPARRGRRT